MRLWSSAQDAAEQSCLRVERRAKIGTASRLKGALWESEDSATLNTSFVERLNLTIRQASAYLRRRSPCRARGADQLRSHVELVRCHYNVVRPHRTLRLGRENQDASHAGWSGEHTYGLGRHLHGLPCHSGVLVAIVETGAAEFPTHSWPHEQRTAA